MKWSVRFTDKMPLEVIADGLRCEDGALIFWVSKPVQIPWRDPVQYFADAYEKQVVKAFAPRCWETATALKGE